jgi:hypothetical protein
MAATNHPKNQQYVPQFLLRNFANERGMLAVFDKASERSFPTSPRGIAAEAWFYDFVDDKGDPQSFEHVLGSLEASVAGIIDRQSLAHLTAEERIGLSFFAAVQQLRVKAMRERVQSLNDGILRVFAERGIDGGDVVREWSDNDLKKQAVEYIKTAQATGFFFYNKAWVLRQASPERPFWISDNPITLHNIVDPNQRGLNSPGIEILFPISPKFSICFMCDRMRQFIQQGVADLKGYEQQFGRPHPGAAEILHQARVIETGEPDLLLPENVDHQNSLQVQYSSRFVIASVDDFALAREMLAKSPKLKEPPGFVVW